MSPVKHVSRSNFQGGLSPGNRRGNGREMQRSTHSPQQKLQRIFTTPHLCRPERPGQGKADPARRMIRGRRKPSAGQGRPGREERCRPPLHRMHSSIGLHVAGRGRGAMRRAAEVFTPAGARRAPVPEPTRADFGADIRASCKGQRRPLPPLPSVRHSPSRGSSNARRNPR